MAWRALAIVFSAALLWASGAAAQEKRLALVIGNSAYKDAPLRNPVNDARLVSKKLKELGFDVTTREDATREAMGAAISEFIGKLTPGGVSLFYYAGHGIQARGRNYLIPIDAKLGVETDLRFQAVDIGAVTEELDQAQSRVGFVVLDACRHNPFERRMRGVMRGLSAIDAARGTLIAYATAPGAVAEDGEGNNSTYTNELVKALELPNLKAEEVFKRVTAAVENRTKGRQTPWISSSLRGDFIFNLTVNVTPGVSADREALFWSSAQSSNRAEEYEEYLKQFPQGMFAGMARMRVAALKALPQVAAAPVPSALPAKPDIVVEPIDKEYVTTQTARLREGPDLKAKQIATLKEGDTLLVLGKVKGQPWYQVERRGEAPAYVSVGLVEEAAAYKKRQEAGSQQQQAMMVPPPAAAPSASTGALPSQGTSFRDCADCPEMVVIPAGSFEMGTTGGGVDEQPVHRVKIPRAFSVGKYEVTFAEWDACVAEGGCGGYKPDDRGWGRGKQPAINVSWNDAKQYVLWLSMKTGKQYRLLNESEWEYVAKEGRSADNGGNVLRGRNQANCDGCGSPWDGKQTAPVGRFAGNRFGMHDLLGNAWEWVEDCWSDGYVGAPSDGSASMRGNCNLRVLRGGSWSTNPGSVRSAFRSGSSTLYRLNNVGLRVARTEAMLPRSESPITKPKIQAETSQPTHDLPVALFGRIGISREDLGLPKSPDAVTPGPPHLIRVTRGDVTVEGRAWLKPGTTNIERMELVTLKFGGKDGTNVFADFTRMPGNGWKIDLAGDQLNLQPYIDDPDILVDFPLTVNTQLRRLRLDDDRALSDVRLAAAFGGMYWDKIVLESKLENRGEFSLRYVPAGDQRDLFVYATDAGAALQMMFGAALARDLSGGELAIRSKRDPTLPNTPVEGVLQLRGFSFRDTPTGNRIINSLVGVDLPGKQLIAEEDLNFSRLEASFRTAGKRIELKNLMALSRGLGINASGGFDLANNQMNVVGYLSPFRGIGQILDKNPWVGASLANVDKQGLIAVPFTGTGTMTAPDFKVDKKPQPLPPGQMREFARLATGKDRDLSAESRMKPSGMK